MYRDVDLKNRKGKIMSKGSLVVIAGFGVLFSAAYVSSTGSAQELGASVREVAPFTYCCVEHKGAFTDMDNVIGRLMQAVESQKIIARGPLVGVYYDSPDDVKPEELRWELGFSVAEQAEPAAPLVKKVWDKTPVAVAVHVGPYEKTGETIYKLLQWMVSRRYLQDGPILERYLDKDPRLVDPSKLRTEIWIPCVKSQPTS